MTIGLAVAMVACQDAVSLKTPVTLGGAGLEDMSFAAGVTASQTVTITSRHFKGTKLDYTASSSNMNVATTNVSGSDVTVTPIGPGTATVTVIAAATVDDEEGTQSLSFTVTVAAPEPPPDPPENNPPEIRTVIGNVSLQVEGTMPLTLSHYYVDREGDNLTYTALSSAPTIATVTTPDAASMITITAVAEGTATITVTASDSVEGNAPVPQMFMVTVTAKPVPPDPNQRPTSSRIPDQTVTVEDDPTVTLTLSMYFDDADRDELTYTAKSSDNMVATVTDPDTDSMITVTAVADGMATITVTATDGKSEPVSRAFDVEVLPENNKPPTAVDGSSRDVVVMVGGDPKTVDLSNYFTDPESDPLTYGATSDMPMTATAMVPEGSSILTVTAVAAGTATITATASDGMSNNDDVPNAAASLMLNVTVTATPIENEPPRVLAGLAANMPLQVGRTQMLTLSMYFSDPDTGDTLTYGAMSDTPTVATVTDPDTDSMITITAVAEGEADITITATDSNGASASTKFKVTVSPIPPPPPANQPPVETAISNISLEVGGTDTVTLSMHFSDPENDTLTYGAMSDATAVATVTDPDADSMITITAVAVGTATITVTASDGENDLVTTMFDVTVTSPSAPTKIKDLPAETLVAGDSPERITLTEYFSDATMYDVVSTDTGVVEAEEADHVLMLTPLEHGTATVSVTPSNAGGNGSPGLFKVTVEAKPEIMEDKDFQDLRIAVGNTNRHPLDLRSHITDPDGNDENLKFNTETDDDDVVGVFEDDRDRSADPIAGVDTVTPPADMTETTARYILIHPVAVGTATITVTATDEDEHDEIFTFDVTVTATANDEVGTVTGSALVADTADPYGVRRFKSSDSESKVVTADNAKVTTYFEDDNLDDLDNPDLLSLEVMYVALTGTDNDELPSIADDAAIKALPKFKEDDIAVEANVDPDTWDGSVRTEISVSVTPREPGAHGVLIVATDLSGTKAAHGFRVQVNNPPEAYSAHEKAADRKTLDNDKSVQGMTVGDMREVRLIEDGDATNGIQGYFSDEDGDSLLCRFRKVNGDAATIGWVSGSERTVLSVTAAKVGEMTVEVWCYDQVDVDSTPATNNDFESSDRVMLYIDVEADGSIH